MVVWVTLSGEDYLVFVLAALLLKQISMFVLLDTNVPTCFRHLCTMLDTRCSNILARFNVPCFMPVCTCTLSF